MGRRKRGRGGGGNQPTTNKFWSNIPQNRTLGQIKTGQNPGTGPGGFQAPHHQQETFPDLTDDTSPNIPMTKNVGGKKTEGISLQGIQEKKPDIQSKSPIFIGLNPAGENKQNNKSPQTTNNASNAQKNVIQNVTPRSGIVQGVASDIKLFSTKNVAVEKDKAATSTNVNPASSTFNKVTVQETKKINIPKVMTQTHAASNIYTIGGKTIDTRITRNPPNIPQKKIVAPKQTVITPTTGVTPNPAAAQAEKRSLLGTPPPMPALHTPMHSNLYRLPALNFSYPKGIPKSFLMGNNDNVPLPYTNIQMKPDFLDIQPTNQNWPQQSQSQMLPTFVPMQSNDYGYNQQRMPETPQNAMYVDTDTGPVEQQAYSPSDVYDDVMGNAEEERAGSESPDMLEAGQKRLSAFQRLGPMTQPKKPKMTINLLCNKDQSVREVVDKTEQKYVPVHLREDIINSKDETVVKYLKLWPWGDKGLPVRKTVMARNSKSVMLLEHEQMEEVYEKDWLFIQISVQGYPREWTKEKLLDTLLDFLNGKNMVPLFIEFAPTECKFLVIRCRAALNAIHKAGFVIRKDNVELTLAISQTELTVTKVDLIPKLILRKRLALGTDGTKLDLSNFTTKEDISHFMYFPLNRPNHQAELLQLKSTIKWNQITELNLSHNRIYSIDEFNLPQNMPSIRHLDLSHNWIEKATVLLPCRDLNLLSLKLEGNPLCHDYTDPNHYVKVLRMMFCALREIDGEPVTLFGEIPKIRRNYCPEEAKPIIDKFLEVFFPLLDATDNKDRASIEELYLENASMTITYRYKLRYGPLYRQCRALFNHSRVIDEGDTDSTDGKEEIARLINKWPHLKHDPLTFTVDVMLHDDSLTIFKVTGIMKVTAETLAVDEHLVSFSRTIVLHTYDGVEYKIANEMVYWDQPTPEYANTSFRITTVRPKRLTLKLESPPDEDLKEKLLEIFMQLTDLDKAASERCLEHRDWNLKQALEYFMKLIKLDEIEILSKGIN